MGGGDWSELESVEMVRMAKNKLGPASVSALVFLDSAFRFPIFHRFSSVHVIKCLYHTQLRDNTGCRHTASTNACNCCFRRSMKCSSYRPKH